MKWLLVLGGLLLTHCATSGSSSSTQGNGAEAGTPWSEAQRELTCVIPVCEEEACSLWRCQDMAVADAPTVVLARATPTVRPPGVNLPHRWWGHPLAAPMFADPVFEIPWHNWNTRGQLNRRELRPLCIVPAHEPFEKHHIFPQQARLARWFKTKNIDIHAFTIRIPRSFHSWIHSGGPEGGQWNDAWRQFIAKNSSASQDEVWRFAFELMNRFGVNGPLVPYACD
ncbi:MAG: TIGR02269 family lipoprotein [Cystobacter sp.]